MTQKNVRHNGKNETSNWKEGNNITVRVDELDEDHKLDNGDLFILTDNHVFKGCFYKGILTVEI